MGATFTAEEEYRRGRGLLEAGRNSEALECFQAAHHLDPRSARYRSFVGVGIAVAERRFNKAQAHLEELGYEVVNPHSTGGAGLMPLVWFMRRDIEALLGCDAIARLPDWGESEGAKAESMVADACGMTVVDLEEKDLK